MPKKDQNGQYVKDFLEWQDKMYSPGEYTGGKLPPAVKYGSKKLMKWYWLMIGIFILVVVIALTFIK